MAAPSPLVAQLTSVQCHVKHSQLVMDDSVVVRKPKRRRKKKTRKLERDPQAAPRLDFAAVVQSGDEEEVPSVAVPAPPSPVKLPGTPVREEFHLGSTDGSSAIDSMRDVVQAELGVLHRSLAFDLRPASSFDVATTVMHNAPAAVAATSTTIRFVTTL